MPSRVSKVIFISVAASYLLCSLIFQSFLWLWIVNSGHEASVLRPAAVHLGQRFPRSRCRVTRVHVDWSRVSSRGDVHHLMTLLIFATVTLKVWMALFFFPC